MQKHKQIHRFGWFTLAVAGILYVGSAAQAAPIAAGNFAGFAPLIDTAEPGGLLAAAPLSVPFAAGGPGGISGTMDSFVYKLDPDNPYAGGGGLTFVFQVHVTGSPIDRFTSNDFTGFNTDVVYDNSNNLGTDIIPTKVTRPTLATVGWNYDSFVTSGQQTAYMVVRTDATQFTISNGNVIDGQVASAAVYGPFNSTLSPEPASLMLLAGVGMLGLRRRK